MAQFRTTADLVDAVLNRAGETTSGTSPYEADALTYLNKVHQSVISGGLIFNVSVDDDWTWARAKYPYVIELQVPFETGTITLTESTDAGTFSSAPTVSLTGWYLRVTGETTTYRIAAHTASATAFEIDGYYVGTTGAGKSFTAFKLDYDLLPSHIYIEAGINDKLDFVRTGSTEATATLTAGAYTPSALATHVQTQVASAAGGSSTYTCTYDSVTRKFTLTSDTAGSDVFYFKCATGTNVARSAWPTLGFDYTDTTNADSQVATYVVGGLSRIVAPIRCFRGSALWKSIQGIDYLTMEEQVPLSRTPEGIPSKFAVIRESADGLHTIRFNAYPSEKCKLEVTVIPVPLDLKDNSASVPLIPRKYADILEYGAAYHILLDKEDDKAAQFSQLAMAQLQLMQNLHRSMLKKTNPNFGGITPRSDQTLQGRGIRYGYDREEN